MTAESKQIEALYVSERKRLERIAARHAGTVDAPDVVQDVFTAVWAKARDSLMLTPAYFSRATQFTSISYFRAERRRLLYLKAITEDQYAAPSIQPDQMFMARQDISRLQDIINALPERTKLVFILNRIHHCTYDEIAVGLEISCSTVEREMARALLACKALDTAND
ncbi:sigma-70 family RNA polymerase sigma factor [Agrobacterium sp. T29]|uniref:sigma-70 family RNA polymerase sigma factor n=1 Tax=Agrobacterium sp. T29 TaxID=2580515 RepID=UPI00143D5E77|nr:sigma-70 family RNA polymerase sigma factor [Agrobacterium sp. T29]